MSVRGRRIYMSVFDEVKGKLRIEDVITGTAPLKKQGRALQGFCPFHDNHRTPALAVWPETQTWKCFSGCGGGDVFDWIEKRDGLDRRGALELLARMAGVELGSMTPEQFKASEKRKEASKVVGAAAEFFRRRLWGGCVESGEWRVGQRARDWCMPGREGGWMRRSRRVDWGTLGRIGMNCGNI